MLDIKILREHPEETLAKLQSKVPEASIDEILHLDTEIRGIKTRAEELKARRNALSKEVGELKRHGKDASSLMGEVGEIGTSIANDDALLRDKEAEFEELMGSLPNIPGDTIPLGKDASENVLIHSWGEKRAFSFPFKNHVELNESLELFDFARGAKISGSGWPTYKGLGAQLEWALIQYMLSVHIKNGFTQWMAPLLVRPEIMYASGQLPKFKGQFYELKDDAFDLYLIPTSEVALNGLHKDEILPEESLPLKYVCYTPCFRREAGAAGSQERGLIRVHQFNKVEMFAFTTPEQSEKVFDQFLASAEEILQGLEIHYRNMLLVTGDMSFGAAKTVDIEVWLPGQNRYYEVSSVSNCTDFQARRSKIRYRKEGEKPSLVHTLNGSGLATSRLMVALLENNQHEDGSITIPQVLRPYLGGLSRLTPKK